MNDTAIDHELFQADKKFQNEKHWLLVYALRFAAAQNDLAQAGADAPGKVLAVNEAEVELMEHALSFSAAVVILERAKGSL